jgi:hypothetical protein
MAGGPGAAGFRAGAVGVPPWSALGPRRGSPDQPERDRHGTRGSPRVPDPLEDPIDRRPLRSQLERPDLTQAGWRLRYRSSRDDEPAECRINHCFGCASACAGVSAATGGARPARSTAGLSAAGLSAARLYSAGTPERSGMSTALPAGSVSGHARRSRAAARPGGPARRSDPGSGPALGGPGPVGHRREGRRATARGM